jgi:hypothetical protein
MISYKIKIVSQINAIILVIILLAIFIGGIVLFVPHGLHRPFSILLTLVSMAIAYSLWQRFVTARTEWTIDNNGIHIAWIKQFAFHHKDDITLEWSEIESIKRGFDPNYYNLIIKLLSGRKIKFYHDTLTTGDDFNQFIKALDQAFLTERYSQR